MESVSPALYIFLLAAFTGYEVIARVPVILHTPLMSGSNFVHGIVLVGAMVALGESRTMVEKKKRIIKKFLAYARLPHNHPRHSWLLKKPH